MPVTGAAGAASYLGKYLSKSFGSEGRRAMLGMSRRWSSSRGWPGSGRVRLAQTDRGGWIDHRFAYEHGVTEETGPRYLRERAGSEVLKAVMERRGKKVGLNTVRRYLDATNDRA